MIADALKKYAKAMREQLKANANASEPALAPKFQALVEDLLPLLDAVPNLTVSPEYQAKSIGRPDIALIRPGQLPRAFIELKAPAKPANPKDWTTAHDKRQFERLKELAHWSTSNFAEFRLFEREKLVGSAQIIPAEAIYPETGDKAADALIDAHDAERFCELLGQLARSQAPSATRPETLAEMLAYSARLVRTTVEDRVAELEEKGDERDPLIMVKKTYRNVLYAHPEAGGYATADFNKLFASAFAQTLAFGLLLVREHLAGTENEEAKQKLDHQAHAHMPEEHPLMKGTLEAISHKQVIDSVGVGFDVMLDTLNNFDPAILRPKKDGRDPILYFYEDFLSVFDPEAREKYGVYYTPLQVVRFMVGALDRVLREDLGTKGLHDNTVTILDPATGTGTFLLGIAERVRDRIMEEQGGPAASMALKNLAERMFGFELLIGPYAVAHYRLHHALANRPPDDEEDDPQPVDLPRLGVYLADTLSEPGAEAPEGKLGVPGIPIDEERAKASEIKAKKQILAIIGNPPYKRLEGNERKTLVGSWMVGFHDEKGKYQAGVWDDLKSPVKGAGKGNQLNTFEEFSVAFWRWAIWKLFEAENAPQKGVIAFITNRKYLTGWPYAGLRKMMRERFDRLEIIDLRGDVRAGVRGNVQRDEGVFNIQVGTAICIAVADGSKADGELAEVLYRDSWEKQTFTKKAKLDWLEELSEHGKAQEYLPVDRGLLDNFRPASFQNGEWIALPELFVFSKSGMKSGSNKKYIAIEHSHLVNSIHLREFDDYSADQISRLSFRPLDNRFYYADLRRLQRPGPAMHAAWGNDNVGLYSHHFGVGLGPAVISTSRIPDYDLWAGRGGYAFPLYDRRKGDEAHNLNPEILAALAAAYGKTITPQDAFDAILALLSATSYTVRFAEDLEDTFPHIPFPADPALFDQAVAIGQEIRALETFSRDPASQFMPKSFFRLRSEPTGPVGLSEGEGGDWCFCENGSGKFDGMDARVWEFAVSGYRVLKRWADARKGLDGAKYWQEFRDIAGRIHELLHWFDEADLVFAKVLDDTLSREELGIVPDTADESDG